MKIFELEILWFTIAPSYYGLMYALTFIVGYIIFIKQKWLSQKQIDDLFFYIVGWVIFGGRLGYILFYNLSSYIESPLNIFKVWEWGMSFHWWVLGVLTAMILFSRKNNLNFYKLADSITFIAPIGISLIRFANYLNKELLGFAYNWPLSVDWRFPSPLLESFLEWIVLFIILFFVRQKQAFIWQIACVFLIGYWFFRIVVEVFVRTPDVQIGYLFGLFSMGTLLSSIMILLGIYYYIRLKKHAKLS